jgi:hypothetical protein
MKIMNILALAAASMMAVPAMAAPNPAASLSVAQSVDTAPSTAKNKRKGGFIIVAILAAAAVVAGIVIVADNDDNADSN